VRADPRRRRGGILAVLALSWLVPEAAHADAVVLDVTGTASVRRGDHLRTNMPFSVAPGSTVRALREDDRIVELRGPFEGTIGGPSSEEGGSWIGRLGTLFGLDGLINLVRLRSDEEHAPDERLIDVTTAGNKCVFSADNLELWMPAPSISTTIAFSSADNWGIRTTWPRRRSRLPWPSRVPVADGAIYVVRAGGTLPIRITLRVASAPFPSAVARMTWLAEMGCQGQLRTALDGLPVDQLGVAE